MNNSYSQIPDKYVDRWDQAEKLFYVDDLAGALSVFKELAEDGCLLAYPEIANIYELGGSNIHKDLEEAKKWYLRSIDENCNIPEVFFSLARIYITIGSSKKELIEARKYLHLLVDEFNHMSALYGLGIIYENGLGVDVDIEKAKNYYEESANQGHVSALRKLIRLNTSKFSLARFKQLTVLFFKRFQIKDTEDVRLGMRWS